MAGAGAVAAEDQPAVLRRGTGLGQKVDRDFHAIDMEPQTGAVISRHDMGPAAGEQRAVQHAGKGPVGHRDRCVAALQRRS